MLRWVFMSLGIEAPCRYLQLGLGLDPQPEKPIVACITRLVPQKGKPATVQPELRPPVGPATLLCCLCWGVISSWYGHDGMVVLMASWQKIYSTCSQNFIRLHLFTCHECVHANTTHLSCAGIHLIKHAIFRVVELGGQFVLLGSGHADGDFR